MVKRQQSGGADTGRGEGATEITASEYAGLLERVYKDADFEKPQNFLGFTKGQPVEEMKKMLMENTKINEDDLRNLADQRAKAVRDWLAERGVSAERLFLLPSRTGGRRQASASPKGEASGQRGGQNAASATTGEGGEQSGQSEQRTRRSTGRKRSRVDIVLK